MRYFILCIITAISINAFSQVTNTQGQQQNQTKVVKIKGIDIPLNNIPLHGSYSIPTSQLKSNPNRESGADEQYAYASENKKRIALVTSQAVKVKSEAAQEYDMYEDRGLFEMFSSNGKLLWSTSQKECIPNDVYLSDDGNYTHLIWISSSEGTEGYQKLISYDKNGKEILTIDNIGYINPNSPNNILYYRLKANPTTYDLTNTLYCYNFQNKKKWEKNFNSLNLIDYVSGSGNLILCLADSFLYCLNQKGEVQWQKTFSIPSGAFLSYDGEIFLRILEYKRIEVYNTLNLQLIFKTEIENTNALDAFILNNSLIAINTNNVPRKCEVFLYDLKGVLLDKIAVRCGQISLKEESKDIISICVGGVEVTKYRVKR